MSNSAVFFVPAAFRSPADSRHRRFLACSFVVPLFILSVAQSKLGYYLLPLAPPVALLAALGAANSWTPGRRATAALAAASALLFGLAGVTARRGYAKFSVTNGAVSVLGLRFNGTAFTSIPVTYP